MIEIVCPKRKKRDWQDMIHILKNIMTKNGHPVIIEVDKLINVVVDEDNSISSV